MLLNLQKVAVIILYNIKQNLRINMRFQPVLHHPLILGVTTHTHTPTHTHPHTLWYECHINTYYQFYYKRP